MIYKANSLWINSSKVWLLQISHSILKLYLAGISFMLQKEVGNKKCRTWLKQPVYKRSIHIGAVFVTVANTYNNTPV